jgi:CHAT domain-containing protein
LLDVEVLVQTNGTCTTVVVTVGDQTDTSKRLIDRTHAELLWDELRSSPENTELIPLVGTVLYDGLVSGTARKLIDDSTKRSRQIRLRLRGLDGDLDSLPWEALCTPERRLIARANTSVVRDLRPPSDDPDSEPSSLSPIEGKVRVLVVIAAPADRDPIDGAAKEVEAIKQAANTKYGFKTRGEVDVLEHATPASLKSSLHAEGGGYDFVHFIAHGEHTSRGPRIWLEDEDGDAVRLESNELVDLFAGQDRDTRPTRLVVLNTCSSAGDGSAGPGKAASSMATDLVLRASVPAVVGMSMKIHTPAAKQFAIAFYKTLFRHGQVDHAMTIARRAVSESNAEWVAPRLYLGSPKPELLGAR